MGRKDYSEYLDRLSRITPETVRWQAMNSGHEYAGGKRVMSRELYGMREKAYSRHHNYIKLGEVSPMTWYEADRADVRKAHQRTSDPMWKVELGYSTSLHCEGGILHGCYFSDVEDAKAFLLQVALGPWLTCEKVREPYRLAKQVEEEKAAQERWERERREAQEEHERKERERARERAERLRFFEHLAAFVNGEVGHELLKVSESAFTGHVLLPTDDAASIIDYKPHDPQLPKVSAVLPVDMGNGAWSLRYVGEDGFTVRRRREGSSRRYGGSAYALKAALRATHLIQLMGGAR